MDEGPGGHHDRRRSHAVNEGLTGGSGSGRRRRYGCPTLLRGERGPVATYQYLARTSAGDEVTGLIQAETETAAVRALDERQLFPVRVTSHERTEKGFRSGRVRARDLAVLYGQLSDLLAADVPALRALEILSRSTINRRLAGHINRIREDVAAGKSLADAMTVFPGVSFSGRPAGLVEPCSPTWPISSSGKMSCETRSAGLWCIRCW